MGMFRLPAPAATGRAVLRPGGGNHTAGNFFASVSGWLCGEIVWIGVNNEGVSENVSNGKAVGQKGAPCLARIAEQREKIPGVSRMWTVLRIVMGSGIGKGIFGRSGASAAIMDVHGENRVRTAFRFHWQPHKMEHNVNAL